MSVLTVVAVWTLPEPAVPRDRIEHRDTGEGERSVLLSLDSLNKVFADNLEKPAMRLVHIETKEPHQHPLSSEGFLLSRVRRSSTSRRPIYPSCLPTSSLDPRVRNKSRRTSHLILPTILIQVLLLHLSPHIHIMTKLALASLLTLTSLEVRTKHSFWIHSKRHFLCDDGL